LDVQVLTELSYWTAAQQVLIQTASYQLCAEGLFRPHRIKDQIAGRV